MSLARASGLLLHPTSLPGPFGIGDLGPAARRWVDFLAGAGCGVWQVLPLNPTGYGDSPYQSFSSFAGNPYLVSPEGLAADGLVTTAEIGSAAHPRFADDHVDYGPVIAWKRDLLDRAHARFAGDAGGALRGAFDEFRGRQAAWLDDHALFMALKEAHGGQAWVEWPAALRDRRPGALKDARREHALAVERHAFRQFVFFRQWRALRDHARRRAVTILGDAPIFVADDSADVWAHPELFQLDDAGRPIVVAGVPPDYFSQTGQRWGNPLYLWERHRAQGYAWWVARLSAVLELVDLVRLDHFRGFAGYWEVPADAPTAETGRWVPGPGAPFLEAVRSALGGLPIVAEDLGEITPDVYELRDRFDLPGMSVLEFAFSGPDNLFLPHRTVPNRVMYTGTHDNDTAAGWFAGAPAHEREFFARYRGPGEDSVPWELMRMAWRSVARWAIAPVQDPLELGSDARMNEPGTTAGNWRWRLPADFFERGAHAIGPRLAELNDVYERRGPALAPPATPGSANPA